VYLCVLYLFFEENTQAKCWFVQLCLLSLSHFPIWYESGTGPYSLTRGLMEMEACVELVGESSVLFVNCKLVEG
jgi:hypothetical protein